jgi:hypothetical protein
MQPNPLVSGFFGLWDSTERALCEAVRSDEKLFNVAHHHNLLCVFRPNEPNRLFNRVDTSLKRLVSVCAVSTKLSDHSSHVASNRENAIPVQSGSKYGKTTGKGMLISLGPRAGEQHQDNGAKGASGDLPASKQNNAFAKVERQTSHTSLMARALGTSAKTSSKRGIEFRGIPPIWKQM